MVMRRVLAAALAAAFAVAPFAVAPAGAASGVNVGSLNCRVAGGSGFIFGSTKNLNCLFTRPDGTAERYRGEIKKYGVDIGFTEGAYMIWLVFAPGNVKKGALAGEVRFLEEMEPASEWEARNLLLRSAVPAPLVHLS